MLCGCAFYHANVLCADNVQFVRAACGAAARTPRRLAGHSFIIIRLILHYGQGRGMLMIGRGSLIDAGADNIVVVIESCELNCGFKL